MDKVESKGKHAKGVKDAKDGLEKSDYSPL
jgi:hypothetical protein